MRDVHKFSAQPVTILLVDDDEDCRQLIRDAIEHGMLDNPVFEVSSGEEALAFLKRKGAYANANAPRPGLIYLDIEMPGMGGQETLKAIRKDPRFADMLRELEPITIHVPHLADRVSLEVQKLGASFDTYMTSGNTPRMMAGYARDWMKQVCAEFDRVGLSKLVKGATNAG